MIVLVEFPIWIPLSAVILFNVRASLHYCMYCALNERIVHCIRCQFMERSNFYFLFSCFASMELHA